MTWYQDGPAIFRDVDVCKRCSRFAEWCTHELRLGSFCVPDRFWLRVGASGTPRRLPSVGLCFNTAPWSEGQLWCAPDARATRPVEMYNECAYEADAFWDDCHAPPTIPGREVVYAVAADAEASTG